MRGYAAGAEEAVCDAVTVSGADVCVRGSDEPFSRSELVTTNTDENAMAAAANIG